MSGGGGSSKSQTTKMEPWSGQQPYLKDVFGTAQDVWRQGVGQQYFPGQTVAQFTPQVQQGIGMLEQSAMGDPTQGAMQNFLMGSMQQPGQLAGVGMDMPGQNPYLDAMFGNVAQQAGQQFQEQTMPGLAAMFGGAGRTGSGAMSQAVGRAAGDFGQSLLGQAADIYGQDYQQGMQRDIERRNLARQIGMGGAAMAPQFQGMQQQNINNMLRAGQITQGQAQQLIDAEKQRWDFSQQAPWQALQQYGGLVHGMPGGYGTQKASGGGGGGGGVMGALGGASTAAGLGQAMGASALGPWALGGAVLGGLF